VNLLRKIITKTKRVKFFISLRMLYRSFGQNKKAIDAENFWKNKTNDKHEYGKLLLEDVKSTFGKNNVKSVIEFGANSGQNLEWFQDSYPGIKLTGIDINKVVKNPETKWSNYKGIIGNQNILKSLENNSFDIAFTMSVLDHIGKRDEVILAINELSRISNKLYLLEPYIEGVDGDVSNLTRAEVKEGLPNPRKIFAKHSYLWNYYDIFDSLNLSVKSKKMPLHIHSLGPFYYLFEVNKF